MLSAIPAQNFGIGAMLAAVKTKHGARLQAVIETGSISTLKAFERNNMSCTILPNTVPFGATNLPISWYFVCALGAA